MSPNLRISTLLCTTVDLAIAWDDLSRPFVLVLLIDASALYYECSSVRVSRILFLLFLFYFQGLIT